MEGINEILTTGAQVGGPVLLIVAIANWIKGWLPENLKGDDRLLPLIPIVVGIGYSILYGGDGFSAAAVAEGLRNGMLAIATFVGGKKLAGHSKWEPSSTPKGEIPKSDQSEEETSEEGKNE